MWFCPGKPQTNISVSANPLSSVCSRDWMPVQYVDLGDSLQGFDLSGWTLVIHCIGRVSQGYATVSLASYSGAVATREWHNILSSAFMKLRNTTDCGSTADRQVCFCVYHQYRCVSRWYSWYYCNCLHTVCTVLALKLWSSETHEHYLHQQFFESLAAQTFLK